MYCFVYFIMLYFYNVCAAFVRQGRPETMRWTIFFRFFRPQRPTTMGTEIFTFSWRRLVHPFTGLDSIGFFDLIAQRRLRLNCRSGMRTYYPNTMSTRSSSLIYVPCFFLTRLLTLSRTLRVTGRSCAWEWEAKQHVASTCDHMIYV